MRLIIQQGPVALTHDACIHNQSLVIIVQLLMFLICGFNLNGIPYFLGYH